MKTEEEVRQFKNRRGEYQSKIRRETGKGYLIYLRKGALTFYAFWAGLRAGNSTAIWTHHFIYLPILFIP